MHGLEQQPRCVQVVEWVGLVALLCGQTIQKTAKPPHQSQIEQAPPASQGKLLCYPRECIAIPVPPLVVHAKPQDEIESSIITPQRIVSKFSFMRRGCCVFDNYSTRFNCCRRTITRRRSSGGVGWFSYQQLSILHPSYRRVCGGGYSISLTQ